MATVPVGMGHFQDTTSSTVLSDIHTSSRMWCNLDQTLSLCRTTGMVLAYPASHQTPKCRQSPAWAHHCCGTGR